MLFSDLAKLGLVRVISLARQKVLSLKFIWTAVNGGWAYVKAVEGGDVCATEEAQKRVRICATCSAFDEEQSVVQDVRAFYCGTGDDENGKPTCGCLVAITVEKQPLQHAGKTIVASESCPRGYWSSCERATMSPY